MEQKAGAQISQRAFIQSLVILFVLMMIAGILTLVVPAGQYNHIQVDGRETIDPTSFHFVEKPDFPIWRWFIAPLEVLGSSSGLTVIVIIVVLFFAGGAFAVMDKTGTLRAFIGRIVRRFRDHKYALLWMVSLAFMFLGGTLGTFEEVVLLVPVMIALSYSLGWDALVGLGMSILATNMGFSAAISNPYTLGVSQQLAGLPLFSGAWFRIIIFIAIYLIFGFFISTYARKIDRDPKSSLIHGDYSAGINPDYDLIENFLNPKRPVRTVRAEAIPFLVKVIRNMIHPGKARVQAASLLGQHRHPKGIYFGGTEQQEETAVLMGLYGTALAGYQNFIQVDLHTGYGPRDQMTVIIPPLDPIPSVEAAKKFDYPLVQKIDTDEFYAISGDMGEYVYRLREAEFPHKNVFVSGFEFGTFGDSLSALIRSLRITVLENQLRHHGVINPQAEKQIRTEYEELFFPSERKWREKALADCRQAFEGIFIAYGIL